MSEPQAPTRARPAYVEAFMEALHAAEVTLVAALPESLLKGVYAALPEEEGIDYVRVSNEADLPGMMAGAYLGGARAVMMMENSGLRQACEPISRLAFAHHVPFVMIVAHRGDRGESNWWGHNHAQVMWPLLDALRIPAWELRTLDELRDGIGRALVHADASQWPVCLVLSGECLEGGSDA